MPSSAAEEAKGAQSVAAYHGNKGPVQVTFPIAMYGGPQQPAFITAIHNLTGISIYKGMLVCLAAIYETATMSSRSERRLLQLRDHGTSRFELAR